MHGTTIGSQTASGANLSMVGSQTAQGNHHAVAGRDARAQEQPTKDGWWARLRKRGMIVAFTTIIGSIEPFPPALGGVLITA